MIELRRERLRVALAPRADANLHADMLLGVLLTRVICGEVISSATIDDIVKRV